MYFLLMGFHVSLVFRSSCALFLISLMLALTPHILTALLLVILSLDDIANDATYIGAMIALGIAARVIAWRLAGDGYILFDSFTRGGKHNTFTCTQTRRSFSLAAESSNTGYYHSTDFCLPPRLVVAAMVCSFVQLCLPPFHHQFLIHTCRRIPSYSVHKIVDFLLGLLPGRVAVIVTPDELREVDA